MICFYIEGKLKVNEELFRKKINRWQVSSGTGGRFEPEWVATFTGMGGRFQPEYASKQLRQEIFRVRRRI